MNAWQADGSDPCANCGQAAHVTMLDGVHLCADCAPKIRRDQFTTVGQRLGWFAAQKHSYPALPWWFLAWRWLQVEATLARNRLRR